MDSQTISRRSVVVAAVSIAIGFSSAAWAAAPNTATMITTKKTCPVCAKKIAEAFRKIDGVTDSRADVETKTFVVFPAVGRVLSPRELWETVERGGEQPIRLAGPSGSFDTKPKF